MKPEERKRHTKTWGLLVLASYSWAGGPSWNEVNVPSVTPVEKINFPVPSRYQLRVAS